MDSKTVIDQIRQNLTGEGLEANKQWKSVVQYNHVEISGLLKKLSEELYKKKFHFIMELLQNAEDNKYPKKTEPFISYTLFDDKLIIKNNESGFTAENVRAICSANKSTKKKVEGYIGEKGIGFKSVFKVSENPEIYSNGFRFRFSAGKRSKSILKYILPEWIDDFPDYVNPELTHIVLPFKKKVSEDFREQLGEIHPNLLLFLKKIKKIEISDESKGEKILLTKKVLRNGIIHLSKQTEKRGAITENNYYYLLRAFSYHVDKQALSGSEERKGLQSTEILIGFPLKKSNRGYTLLTREDCNLYAYLPIKDVNFRFLIQADFILNSSREDIDEGKVWNEWIMKKLETAVIDAILSLRVTPYWKEYLNLLPRRHDISDSTFKKLAEAVINTIKYKKSIPIRDTKGLSWIFPSKAIKYNSQADEVFTNRWLKELLNIQLVHPYATIAEGVSERLEIKSWGWDNIASCLEKPKFIKSLNIERRNKLYAYLAEKCEDVSSRKDELRKLPIFFINGSNNPQSFNETDDGIFWPLESRQNFSFLSELRFLNLNYRLSSLKRGNKTRKLFTFLGVREASIKYIVKNFIIPKFVEGDEKNEISDVIDKHRIEIFQFLVGKYSILKKDNDMLKQVREYIWLYSDSDKTYHRPSNLYLGAAYQKEVQWEKFLTGDDVDYLSPSYLFGLDESMKKDALILLDDLKVRRLAETSHLIDCFKSGNPERIKYTLIYLDKNWASYKYSSQVNSLKSAIVIPIKQGLISPSKVFASISKNQRILKNTVHYLPGYIKNKDFIIDIGINTSSIPSSNLVMVLEILREKKTKDIKRLTGIYKEFKREDKLIDTFSDEKLIYCARRRKWITSWEAVWVLDDENFYNLFSEIKSQYPSLRSFFTDIIEISPVLEFSNIFRFLKSVSGQENIDDKMRLNVENSLLFLFSQLSKKKISSNEINKLLGILCIPDQLNNLRYSEDSYLVDDTVLYEVFKNTETYLFKLSKNAAGYLNFLRAYTEEIGMNLLSSAVKAKIKNENDFKIDKDISKELKEAILSVSYIVYHRFRKIHDNFTDIQKNPKGLQCLVGEKVVVEYSLNGFKRIGDEAIFINENKVFLKSLSIQQVELYLQNILFRFYNNIEEIKDIIIFLTGMNDPDAFQKYLFAHKLPLPERPSDMVPHKRKKLQVVKIDQESEIDDDDEIVENQKQESENEAQLPKLISINRKKWKPQSEPDFSVEVEEAAEDIIEGGKQQVQASQGRSPGTFNKFKIYNSNGSEHEIGNWGEDFVFNNIVNQLRRQFPEELYVHAAGDRYFRIYDAGKKEIASIVNSNIDGFNQSGYDLVKTINGSIKYIEVKSTTWAGTARFIIGKEQWNCCRQNPDQYELYFVKEAGSKNARIVHVPDFYYRYQKGLIKVLPHNLEVII